MAKPLKLPRRCPLKRHRECRFPEEEINDLLGQDFMAMLTRIKKRRSEAADTPLVAKASFVDSPNANAVGCLTLLPQH